MRKIILGLSAVALAAVAAPAMAEEETSAITINGGATLVSDYRFRGISQTDKEFAVQGSLTVSHASGVYATVWGSSIDDYVAGGSDQEIDLIVGYKKSFGSTTLDLGVLYYFYPGSQQNVQLARLVEEDPTLPATNSDFFEPYVSVSQAFGPATVKGTLNYAPKQKALAYVSPASGKVYDKADSLYGALDLSGAIPDTGVSLSAHLGHYFTRSFLSAAKHYTDWSVGASYAWKNLTFGISYVDTDLPKDYFLGLSGKDVAKAGVVASVGVSF